MTSICYLLLSFLLFVAGTVQETPQEVVTRYNNYKAICKGLDFKNVGNKDTIAFQSSLIKTLKYVSSRSTVVFDKVSLNEGNAYDKISGKFTAPSNGIYFFTWTTLSNAGKTFGTDIVRNGEIIAKNFSDGRGRIGFDMSTSHANIKMKKGDKVWIRTHDTWGQFAHGDWCFFSGLKL
uniref:C1q domain-containing protein n=1 Tax=Magallana gigas TaxID=29159 RepID=A0A8W8LTT9_MAGGI|nr:complement C1q tumor necrosis factor-related protein 4-like [Crassostrea gigas]